MRRFIFAAMLIALLPVPAYSQASRGPATVETDAERKHDAEIDKAYRETMKRMKGEEKAAKTDPWQMIRTVPDDNAKH
jgi:hypothetical protein